MTTKIKKLAAGLLLLALMTVALPGQLLVSFAATGKITFSDPSVTVGNQVSVSMKIASTSGEGLGASDIMLEYDSSMLEFVSGTSANGGAGSVRVLGTMESEGQTSFSFTLKFKALKAGSTTIKVKSQEVYDSNSQAVSISHVGSSAVKVNAPATYSKEASLSSLEISPGTLSPAFSPEVTSYTATVSGDVSKVTVSAPAKDSKARVVVSGNDNLQVGENSIVCKVTAEDGETVKNYTITVTKTEGTESESGETGSVPVDANAQGSGMNVKIGEEDLQVAQSFDAAALPDGFTSADYEYNGTTVQSGYNEAEGLRVLYLTNESGDGDFYLYFEEDGSFAPYVIVRMAEKSIVVLPADSRPEDIKIPEGFKPCTIDVGTHSVHGWIWDTNDNSTPEYCVVYAMNSDGERGLYRYDQKEMTLQRYFQDPDAESAKEKLKEIADDFNELLDDYKVRGWIIAGLFAVCIILVIVLIVLLLTRKPGGPKDRGHREPDPDLYNYARPSRNGQGSRRTGDKSGDYEDEDDFMEERDYEDSRYDRYGTKRGGRRDEFSYDDDQIEDLDEEFDELEMQEEAPTYRNGDQGEIPGAPVRSSAAGRSQMSKRAPADGRTPSSERKAVKPQDQPVRRASASGRTPDAERTPVSGGSRTSADRAVRNQASRTPKSVADVEKDIAATLAKEADRAVTAKKSGDEDDDFEFIDLDL